MTSTQNMGNDTLHDNLKTRLQGCKGGKLEPNGERREGALWPVPRIAFSVTLCHTGGHFFGVMTVMTLVSCGIIWDPF